MFATMNSIFQDCRKEMKGYSKYYYLFIIIISGILLIPFYLLYKIGSEVYNLVKTN